MYDFSIQMWSEVVIPSTNNKPAPRAYASILKFDEDTFFLFGGHVPSKYFNSLWKFDTKKVEWTLLSPLGADGAPSPRSTVPCLAKLDDKRLIIMGGQQANYAILTDAFIFNLETGTWQQLYVDNSSFKGCALGSGPYSYPTCTRVNNAIYTVDVADGLVWNLDVPSINDTIRWSAAGKLSQGRSELLWFSITSDGENIYWFGKSQNSIKTNELMQFSTITNRVVETEAMNTPPYSVYHTAVTIGSSMIVYGGRQLRDQIVKTLYILDLNTMTWASPPVEGNIPTPRSQHTAVVRYDQMVVFGGLSQDGTVLGDLWAYSLRINRWTPITSYPDEDNGYPAARYGHTAVHDESQMIVFGGKVDGLETTASLTDAWSLDIKTFTWKRILINNTYTTTATYGCKSALIDDYYFAIAGCENLNNRLPDGTIYILNLKTEQWELMISDIDVFEVRTVAQTDIALVAVSKSRILLHEGRWLGIMYGQFIEVQNYLNPIDKLPYYAVKRIIPSDSTTPRSRIGHTAIYFGNTMFVYGGAGGSSYQVNKNNFVYNDAWSYNLEPICDNFEENSEASSNCYPCSPGTKNVNGVCVVCPIGEYNENFGSKICNKCPPGTYAFQPGAQSRDLCLKCPFGTYNPLSGQKECISCGENDLCPIGSANKLTYSYRTAMDSTLEFNDLLGAQIDDDQYLNRLKYIILGVGCGAILLVMTIISSSVCVFWLAGMSMKKLKWLDIFFGLSHDVNEGASPVKRSTALGALFSVTAFLMFIILICFSLIDYWGFNTIYSDSLEQKSVVVPRGVYTINATLYGTSDCSAKILTPGVSGATTKYLADDFARKCTILWECDNSNSTNIQCDYAGSDLEVTFQLSNQTDSMYYSLDYQVSTPYFFNSSFIYNGQRIISNPGHVFRGRDPTTIPIVLTGIELHKLKKRVLGYLGIGRKIEQYYGASVQSVGARPGSQTRSFSPIDDSSVNIVFRVTINPTSRIITQTVVQTPLNLVSQIGSLILSTVSILAIIFSPVDRLKTMVIGYRRRIILTDPSPSNKSTNVDEISSSC
jgi:hypothetical protein